MVDPTFRNPPTPACQHSRQHRVRQTYHRVDVDGDQLAVPVRVDLGQRAVCAEPRIVDQDVHRPSSEHANQGVGARLAAKIADRDLDLDVGGQAPNPLLHLRQTGVVPPGQQNRHSPLRELLGEQCAKARTRARDHGPAGFVILRHVKTSHRCLRCLHQSMLTSLT
jgi:hypothetical protein